MRAKNKDNFSEVCITLEENEILNTLFRGFTHFFFYLCNYFLNKLINEKIIINPKLET